MRQRHVAMLYSASIGLAIIIVALLFCDLMRRSATEVEAVSVRSRSDVESVTDSTYEVSFQEADEEIVVATLAKGTHVRELEFTRCYITASMLLPVSGTSTILRIRFDQCNGFGTGVLTALAQFLGLGSIEFVSCTDLAHNDVEVLRQSASLITVVHSDCPGMAGFNDPVGSRPRIMPRLDD